MKNSNAIKILNTDSYKIGINEIEGLKDAMTQVLKPIQDHIDSEVYWGPYKFEESEYKSRDGFIPYSSNYGGLELTVYIPKCESYDFPYVEFGECDECNGETQCGYHGQECASEGEGHLDAKLRIWLKFEGYNEETGELSFYLYVGGGNGDAPYFRSKYETDIFEAEFSAKSIKGISRAASKHVKALLKVIGG